MTEPSIAVLFLVAHRHVETAVFRGLAAAGFGDITLAQGRLLARVDEDGSRVTTLAEASQVTKQTAGYLVDQLERLGYVERVADPSDARARLVRLSDKGHEVAAVANGIARAIEAEWTAHLGADQMETLRGLMGRLREITDPFA